MTDIKLTIAIPTYNRPQAVVDQVHRLLPQLTDEVKLIILDNASPVRVDSLFTDEEKEHFTIIRHRFNIGGDANIARCFELCESDWLWTLSDDDVIADNAVQIILETISNRSDKTLMLTFVKDVSYCATGLKEFGQLAKYKTMYVHLFWMSACVYQMSPLREYMSYYYHALSTMQPSIVMISRALKKNPTFKVEIIPFELCPIGGKDIGWNRIEFVYSSMFAMDMLRDLSNEYDKTLFDVMLLCCICHIRKARYQKRISYITVLRMYVYLIRRYGLFSMFFRHGYTFIRQTTKHHNY